MSNVVSITTFASRCRRRRAAAASPRSRRAPACGRPSGRRPASGAAPRSTASSPSAASPTTSMSGSASRIIRKPVRTSAWSSTIRTRTPARRRRVAASSSWRSARCGAVSPVSRAQRREVAVEALDRELVDADRPVEVLQLMRPEVVQRRAVAALLLVLEQRPGRLREQDLAAVARRRRSGRRGARRARRSDRLRPSPRRCGRRSARAAPRPPATTWSARARCAATAASTACRGRRNATKNESPSSSSSRPPWASQASAEQAPVVAR